MGSPDDRDFDSPAEERLGDHLALMRVEAPISRPGLTWAVLRTLRWQRALLTPLRAGSAIAFGLFGALRGLLGGGRRAS